MISSFRCHFLALLSFLFAAHGTVVTTTTDEDNGILGGGSGISLREAVKYSSAGTTITFTPALSGQTIRLTLGEITIAKSLTIDGSGLPAQITLSSDKTGDGKTSDDSRIITIITGAVLFDSLILARGYPGSGSNRNGGAIHVDSTSTQLTIRNSTLTVDQSIVAGTFLGLNNFTSGNPLLAPLGNYGGPTQTMPPLPGSPAIGAGGATTLTTDQRGFPRTSKSDIGAAVYPASPDVAKFWTLDSDGDGSPYGTEQALGTDAAVADSTHTRNLAAPVLTSSGHAVVRFGIGAAAPGTHWILSRSSDLLTFAEIYRYSGTKDTSVLGVTFLRTATGVTVTDTNPPPGGAFYRFEARLEP